MITRSLRCLRGLAATVALGAAALAIPAVGQAQDTGLPIGTQAPSALLHTLDGKTVDLAKLVAGRPAVVEFWATWCSSCEELLPALQKAQRTYGSRVAFVGVSVSAQQSVKRVKLHVAKHKVPGIQLFDTRGSATGSWDVPATSHIVVLNKAGKVVYTGVGGDQNIEAAIRKAL